MWIKALAAQAGAAPGRHRDQEDLGNAVGHRDPGDLIERWISAGSAGVVGRVALLPLLDGAKAAAG